MLEWEIKNLFVDIGKRMWQRGFVASNDGNFSVRLNEKEILTTPTGVSKGFMSADMMVKVDYDGNPLIKNPAYKPSSEIKMHLDIYKNREDINAVCHAHPPYATSFAVAGIPLDKCILPEAIVILGAVQIAGYGLPSTNELPEMIRPFIRNSDAVLLQNHGALTMGKDFMDAYFKMETLEHSANIIWKAIQLGNLNILPPEERDRLLTLRETYNLSGKVSVCKTEPSDEPCECKSKPKVNVDEDMVKNIIDSTLKKLGK